MSITTPSIPEPKIRGMQGQTWSETIRTDEQYYEMAFPRVLAVAERAWHSASWELDWSPGLAFDATTNLVPKDELAADYNGFVSALGCREAFKLEKLGIAYRVPPPGASIDASGVLTANSELPCMVTMYSVDEGNMWSKYSGPVGVGAGTVVLMQSVSLNGVLKSRIVVIDEECTDCGNDGNVNADDSQQVASPNEMALSNASKLATNLRVMIEMRKNFNHSADCSMGDWGLCHTQDLTLVYTGESDYLAK